MEKESMEHDVADGFMQLPSTIADASSTSLLTSPEAD